MFCSKCGGQIREGSAFCTNCGEPVEPSAPIQSPATSPITPPAYAPPLQEPTAQYGWKAAQSPVAYAGFWLRAVAWILDGIILAFAGAVIFFPLFGANLHSFSRDNPWEFYTTFSRPIVALKLLGIMLSWIYYASLESSVWQATLGKKALGLQVTDLYGNRITFARASGRYFGTLVSSFVLGIGFLMAGFTARKQALHDILAGCLVIKQL
jgi:uncharacterized RDD family membrane protein YckC